ncbi:MAG: VTT domain-containing protein [Bdellovibrionales bacterium]
MTDILEIVRHLPEHLQIWAGAYGPGLYAILALIIFAETGLVVTPLLPGDSLLFAAGSILALGVPGLNLPVMCVILILAAFTGDLVNYHVGKWAAPKIFINGNLKWLNRRHLAKTQEFYAKHGGKTIILARFIPIVRTYAPFVAGVGGFTLRRFILFSLTGGTLWIVLFLNLGYFFGNIPAVKKNFELVILAICAVSVAPVVIEWLKSRRQPV